MTKARFIRGPFFMIFETSYFKKNYPQTLLAFDEVGRGPLAGPVVACGVSVFIPDFIHLKKWDKFLTGIGIQDSKKLKARPRQKILHTLGIDATQLLFGKRYEVVTDWGRVGFCLSEVSPQEIDEINILQASLLCMHKCEQLLSVSDLKQNQAFGLVDGNRLFKTNTTDLKLYGVIKGDAKSKWIGLASIIAKERRDFLMHNLDRDYPVYGLKDHQGYPTLKHRRAIEKHGPSSIHRKSFKGVKEFLQGTF